MKGSNIEQEYTKYWVDWRESERKYYKLLIPTKEELELKELGLRLLRANELKEYGNFLFRNQDYNNAIQKYIESIEAIPRDLFINNFITEYNKLKLSIITNLSICFAKSKNNEAAILQCKEGLKIFPDNVKLRYILGGVFGDIQEYDESLKVLKEAKELDSNNRDVIERIKNISKAKKEYNDKMKEMFGGKLKPACKEIKKDYKEEEKELNGDNEQKIETIKNSNNWGYYLLGAVSIIGIAGYLYKKTR